jgi:hypothetical protein
MWSCSYPVPKEVGKVGTNSSTYVEPVSERKDGIASFFKRQEEKGQGTSQSLIKSKIETWTSNSSTKMHVEKEVHNPVKADSKDVKGVKGLGDDSNAPQGSSGQGKRKAREEAHEEPVDTPHQQSKRIRTTAQDRKPVEVKSESDDDIEILDKPEFMEPKNKPTKEEKGGDVKVEVSRSNCADRTND